MKDGPTHELAAGVGALRRRLLEALAPLVPAEAPVALLGFPRYGNVGDAILWLGALEALEALGRGAPCYASEERTFDRADLARLVPPEATVLLAGGGSFGDLWPPLHAFRLAVIDAARGRRVVQLPQSVHFERRATREVTARALESHGDVHLVVREEESLARARDAFDVPVTLAPDLAFAFTPPARGPAPPDAPPRWLVRADREGHNRDAVRPAGWSGDDGGWTREPRRWARRRGRALERLVAAWPRAPRRLHRALERSYVARARSRVAPALRWLAGGPVLVTDRLHGHLAALLLGRPHVLLPSGYGKIDATLATFTGDLPGVHRARDVEEAVARAEAIARGGSGG